MEVIVENGLFTHEELQQILDPMRMTEPRVTGKKLLSVDLEDTVLVRSQTVCVENVPYSMNSRSEVQSV